MSDIVNKENNGKLVRIGIKYFKIIQHPNYGTILKPFNGTFAKIEIENNPSLLVKKFVDFIDFDSDDENFLNIRLFRKIKVKEIGYKIPKTIYIKLDSLNTVESFDK